MVVLEVDSFFPDFGGFIVLGLLIDPPAVCLVFPVNMSQIVAMTGASQKNGNQQKEGNRRRDEPASCNKRSHNGAYPFNSELYFNFRPLPLKLDPLFAGHGIRNGQRIPQ